MLIRIDKLICEDIILVSWQINLLSVIMFVQEIHVAWQCEDVEQGYQGFGRQIRQWGSRYSLAWEIRYWGSSAKVLPFILCVLCIWCTGRRNANRESGRNYPTTPRIWLNLMQHLILRTPQMQRLILRTLSDVAPNTQDSTWHKITSSWDTRRSPLYFFLTWVTIDFIAWNC